jgi:enterochelin esterase-like enzyme
MAQERKFFVYLPPGYQLPSAAARRYPVIYLLHGDPGSPPDWIHLGAPALMDEGIDRRLVPPMIMVFADGNGRVGGATQWANRYDGRDRVEDALLELVTTVDQRYRTLPDRRDRFIGGLSSGAFGAANLAARHPGIFGTAMSFSGYFIARGPVFGGIKTDIWANSPYDLVQVKSAARTVDYILAVGSSDPRYERSTVAFANELSQLRVAHSLHFVAGAHSSSAWIEALQYALTVLATRYSR